MELSKGKKICDDVGGVEGRGGIRENIIIDDLGKKCEGKKLKEM